MTRGSRWFAPFLLLGMLALPAAALDPCVGGPDPVLTVGWPVGREAELARLQETIRAFHRQSGRCPNKSLQVNVAYGTDYELLAWITSGAVDGALLTPLAVDLAGRDGVALRRVAKWQESSFTLSPADARLDDFLGRLEDLGADGADRVFFTVPSHLSNEFSVLLEAAARRVTERHLDPAAFWRSFFAHLCFRPLAQGRDRLAPCVVAAEDSPVVPVELALRFDRSSAAEPAGGLPGVVAGSEVLLPEWLTIRALSAARLFRANPDTDLDFPPLGAATLQLLADPPAIEIRQLAEADPRLGARAFEFTIGEAVGLLAAHGQASGRPGLALVLPGGGVKAAYQTTVLDALYDQRYLRNRLAGGFGYGPGASAPLDVDLVTGTSGGALVGYFVSRLDGEGPFELTCRLWFGGPGCPKALDHDDIFPPADLLRYLSLVVVFVIFSLALLAAAARRRSPFSLESRSLAPGEAARYRARPLLAIFGTLLLLLTPFAVRWVNGARQQEHIPDVEGFLFLFLALLAMFADQCLMAVDDRRAAPVGRAAAAITFGAGLVAIALPLWATSTASVPESEAIAPTVSFWAAFALLAPLFVVPIVIGHSRLRGLGTVPRASGFLSGLAVFVGVSSATLVLYLTVGFVQRGVQAASPFIFGLLLLAALLFFFLRAPDRVGSRRELWGLYLLSQGVAALFLLSLTRPGTDLAGLSFQQILGEPSHIDVSLDSLSVSMGSVLSFAGFLFGLGALRPRYQLEKVSTFALALAVCLVHAGLTFSIVWGLSVWAKVPFFELAVDYWLVLVLTALVLAALGLVAAALFARGVLRQAFEFLASPHPNGRFRVRRHVRMVHFAVFAWGFWNLVVAPGLYGNRMAEDYLRKVAAGFPAGQGFTARLLVPANALQPAGEDTDGSRYFLMVPQAMPCPPIPARPTSGGRWYVFHVLSTGEHDQQDNHCPDLDSLAPVESMIFASGSPFPVFPAHQVRIPNEERPEFLVDGGYSNNVPIAPGQNLEVEQVLVVDSTNPLARKPPSALARQLAKLVGSLVNDVLRLPGYLFSRAQVLDLQSRRGFFVVRIAPHRDHDAGWPFLADFRTETVNKTTAAAKEDLSRRVARVESWGQPRFVRSWRTAG